MEGGANSEVFKLRAEGGEPYVAKFYGRPTADGKDRMHSEVTGLSFLRKRGVTCVAHPVAWDQSENCAIFEYIEGARLRPDEASAADVDQASSFLLELSLLADGAAHEELPIAAEACFSLDELFDNVGGRLQKLRGLLERGPKYAGLRRFLDQEFDPAFQMVSTWSAGRIAELGDQPSRVISQSERTLSPSDFGFHNCLRRPDGRLTFVDFEYFGWDDPVKMVSDFLFHPGMSLTKDLKLRFVCNLRPLFETRPGLELRLPVLYPLFGLKWCLIFLNEFFPETLARRTGSYHGRLSEEEILDSQLAKSVSMCRTVTSTYDSFPYWCD